MTQDIQNFIQYLHQEKNTSENTEVSYARDLKKMNQYLLTQGICDVNEVTATSLTSYVIYLEKEGRKPATISRSIASMKAFYHYMEKERRLAVDPSERLKAPRIEKKNADDSIDDGRGDAPFGTAGRYIAEGTAG